MNNSTHSNTKHITSNDRFAQLSEKISQIPRTSHTQKLSKIEQRLNSASDVFATNISSLEQKYLILNEQISKFGALLDNDIQTKLKQTQKAHDDIQSYETKVKQLLLAERASLKQYIDNAVTKLTTMIQQYSTEFKADSDSFKTTIDQLNTVMQRELPSLEEKIDNENEERLNSIKALVKDMNEQFQKVHDEIDVKRAKRVDNERAFAQSVENVYDKVKDEFAKEQQQRESFEENVFTLIEDVCTKLVSNGNSNSNYTEYNG